MSKASAKKSYEKLKNNPDYIKRHAEYSRKSYQKRKNDPEFKLRRGRINKKFIELNSEYVKQRAKEYRQRPEVKERHIIQERLRRESKNEELKQQQRDKYHNNEVHRKAMKDYGKWYRTQNTESIKIKDHKRKLKLKFDVFSHYSNGNIKCSCCAETEFMFLSLDHINGGGNRHRKALRKSGINFYAWLIRTGYPSGYSIMCMNCNWGKRMNNDICPHKTQT